MVPSRLRERALQKKPNRTKNNSKTNVGANSLRSLRTTEIYDSFNANAPDQSEFDISSVATIVAAVEALVADQKS